MRRLKRTLAVDAHVAVIDFAELRIFIYLGRRALEVRAAEDRRGLPRTPKGDEEAIAPNRKSRPIDSPAIRACRCPSGVNSTV